MVFKNHELMAGSRIRAFKAQVSYLFDEIAAFTRLPSTHDLAPDSDHIQL